MIGAVIVTHGKLAEELVAATERIVGPTERLVAVSLGWDDEVADARAQIAEAIESVQGDDRVLVFTDMFGGTPTNVAITFLESGRVEIITGVNLPMLVKLTSLQDSDGDLLEIARQIRARGQNSVYVATDILASQES